MPQELDAIEASRRLRITPELLYQYVRYGAKGKEGRRLECVPGSSARRFIDSELDRFDEWLAEPWAEPGSPRIDPPQGVRDYLKVESGGVCPSCGSAGPFQDAHIEEWSVSRSNHHHNLLRLCLICHRRYDEGAIARAEIERIKKDAVDRVQARIHRPVSPVWPIDGAPPVARDFVGREDELNWTIDCLSSARSISIVGVGGIGKTQLVLNALRDAAQNRPVFWIGIDTTSESTSVGDALLNSARERGVEFRDGRPRFDQIRACIVFDGIERIRDDGDEVADLIERLLADQVDTLIVATSQISLATLDFDETLALGPLSEEAAANILGTAEQSPHLDALVEFADGHPLTLRLLQVLLRHHRSAANVESEFARRGAAAIADPQRRRHTARSSLVACLELAYSQLNDEEKRLLWMVAASPAGFRPALHDIPKLIGPNAAAALAGIQAWNLVDQYADEEFESGTPPHAFLYMLSPVRAFVQQASASDAFQDWRQIALSFCYSQMVLSTFIQNGMLRNGTSLVGQALMHRELPNTLSAFDIAGQRSDGDRSFLPVVISIGHSTMMTLFTSGSFALGADLMRRAAAIAARNGSLVDALQFLFQMQTLAERQLDREAASLAMSEAERLANGEQGEPRALLLLMKASSAEREERYDLAAELARESYDLFRELPGCEEECLKSAGFTLGRALEFGGRAAEALPYFRDALDCAEREADPINRGSILHHIGNCEAYAGRAQEAMHAYRKAGEQHVELETVEFISNSLGEAGLIVAKLDPIVGLPGKGTVDAALMDIVDQLELLLSEEMYGGRNPLVTLRKFIGIVSLALHVGHERRLRDVADDMYSRFVEPLAHISGEPPEWHKVMLFHIQWIIRLLQFLAHVSDPDQHRSLLPSEMFLLGWLSARAFTALDRFVPEPIVSYLQRRRGMHGITATGFLRVMQSEGDEAVLQAAQIEALEAGVDLGWLF